MKKKIKNPLDYLTSWHKAVLAIIFFVLIGIKVMAIAGDVEQTKQEVKKINLWRIHEKIWTLENRYSCYSEPECLAKMPVEVKQQYRDLIEERKEMMKEIK